MGPLPTAPEPVRPPAPPPKPPAAPAPPPAPATSLEDDLTAVINRLVSSFAHSLESMAQMPKADRDAIHRVELKRMADGCASVLEQHGIPDSPHVAHVMTLSCDKVIKDAKRHALDSFSDGRLEQALYQLCIDFVPLQGN